MLKAQNVLKDGEKKQVSLKAARINAELTQKQAADELHINKNTLANYEAYLTKPDIETSKKIAELYGCTIDDIRFHAR